MNTALLLISALNGAAYGLLLFMLASGLTLIFSMMGVLNVAHANFYMLGAYTGYQLGRWTGFWPALTLAPLVIGTLGCLVERHGLRKLHARGHVAELLLTFAISYVITDVVQVVWGRPPVPYRLPAGLDGTLFSIYSINFPRARAFVMLVAALIFGSLGLWLRFGRVGLVIQAALSHPATAQTLGHDVPRIRMLVFGGGTALAALAGVIGGALNVTEPAMGAQVGAILFAVVVIGGMGSLAGAFLASLLVGEVDAFAKVTDLSAANLAAGLGLPVAPAFIPEAIWQLKLSQAAPSLPFLLLVLVLVLRPRGLLGRRAD